LHRTAAFFFSSLKNKTLRTKFLPSTILDLAKNPEDVFKAPLNTTKLAPVTRGSRNKVSTTSNHSSLSLLTFTLHSLLKKEAKKGTTILKALTEIPY